MIKLNFVNPPKPQLMVIQFNQTPDSVFLIQQNPHEPSSLFVKTGSLKNWKKVKCLNLLLIILFIKYR